MTRINITDDMIERLARCEYEEDWGAGSWERVPNDAKRRRLDIARAHLQAALNRRTGPKDRRVEWDDLVKKHSGRRTHSCGRRDYDTVFWTTLPRTSHRLKREAEERCKLTPVNIACPNCSKRFEFFISCGGTP